VSRRAVKSLLPYARNARTHSQEQVQQIAASIREWGFTVPVLVDDAGTLIAGHGRVLAAQSLGLADVPTMVATGWSAEQIRAYRLADNRIALSAGWDDDALKFELAELQDAGFDLGLTGFGEHELMGLLVVHAGASLGETTVNLRAPLVINVANGRAAQVVLDDPELAVAAPLLG